MNDEIEKKIRIIVVLGYALQFTSFCPFAAPQVHEYGWSVRMAESIMKEFPHVWMMEDRVEPKWSYTYGLVGVAFQKLWERTGEQRYYDYTKEYVDTIIDQNGNIQGYEPLKYNVDNIAPGRILIFLYDKTGDDKYRKALSALHGQLKTHPRTKAGGFWHKQVYPHQVWLDGLYMWAPFYAGYASTFNQSDHYDDIVSQLLSIEIKARDSETGLLYHGWDESRQQKWADPETGCSPNFWGRAMGWYAMALVDVLDYLPEEHQGRQDVIIVIKRLAKAISHVQDPETGLWYQVLDQGGREGNYLEGSVSSMFTYALLKAVRKDYIGEEYLDVAVKAYDGIIEHLIKVEPGGRIVLTQVCAVAGLGGNPYRDGSYEYYVNGRRRDNDPKAVGPFILASLEFEHLCESVRCEHTEGCR